MSKVLPSVAARREQAEGTNFGSWDMMFRCLYSCTNPYGESLLQL